MKKIIFVCLCILLIFFMQTVCFAEETGELASSDMAEASTGIEEEENAAEGEITEATHTFVSRICEYAEENKTEILGVVGDALIAVVLFVTTRVLKRRTSDMSVDLKNVRGDTTGTRTQQEAVVGAMNGLIGAYNGMQQTYEKYEGAEDDRNKLIGALVVQNTAILDMLQTVYVNSKHLPQGVKDVIVFKYAKALQTLDNDELLRDVVMSVHEKVGGVQYNITDEGGGGEEK